MGNNKTRNPKSPTIKDPPIELKIKPKACALCGKPYIPTGPRAKFCPKCRELPKGKRDASLFAKHAEAAFGKGPWATYMPEPDPVPEYFGLAMDAARAIAHDTRRNGVHVFTAQSWYEQGRGFLPMVNVTPETFYTLFDLREYEYRCGANGCLYLAGMIEDVEVLAWL